MRIWNVTVECWFVNGANGGFDSIRRDVEVEAATSHEARTAAIEFCDQTANSSVREWTRFEFIKSCSVPPIKYPREVTAPVSAVKD